MRACPVLTVAAPRHGRIPEQASLPNSCQEATQRGQLPLETSRRRCLAREEPKFKRPQQEMPQDHIRLDRQGHLLLAVISKQTSWVTYLACSCDGSVCQRKCRHMFQPQGRSYPESGQDDSSLCIPMEEGQCWLAVRCCG